MSPSSSSNRPAALGALLWIFLIIGAAGLVLTMLSIAGVLSIGNIIGIILLLVGIVGAVLFAYISSYFTPASPAKEAAVALATAADGPSADVPPAAEAVIVDTSTGEAFPVAEVPVAEVVAEVPVAEVVAETPSGEALVVEDVVAEVPVAEVVTEVPVAAVLAEIPVADIITEAPTASAVYIQIPDAVASSSEPATPPQMGFSFVSHTQSFHWRGVGAPGTEEWVFALANSPTVTHTYRVAAREASSSSAWYPGGGIVDITIDGVPTGQLMVVANEKKTREDVAGGVLYRLEMGITSDGLAPATIASQVTVNGIALQ